MEVSANIKKSKRRSKIKESELENSVPEAPTLDDFNLLNVTNSSEQEEEEEEEESGEKIDNEIGDKENEEIIDDGDKDLTVQIQTEEANAADLENSVNPVVENDENIKKEIECKKEAESIKIIYSNPKNVSPVNYPTLEGLEISALSISDEIEIENVDPCEEALKTIQCSVSQECVLPSAPMNCESGEFYSLLSNKNSLESLKSLRNSKLLYPFEELKEISEDGDGINKEMESEATNAVLIEQMKIEPFTEEQIKSIYSNYLLDTEEKIMEFCDKTYQASYENFELYELLRNYMRACNQLHACEKSLSSFKDNCENDEKQIWTLSTEVLTRNAECMDKNHVVATHKINTTKFNNTIFSNLKRSLKEIKELIRESYSLYSYSVELTKSQIDHFFYKNFNRIILPSSEIQGYSSDYPSQEIEYFANSLKDCISILFTFIRKPNHTIELGFIENCKDWLTKCVGLLLRIATIQDHFFILNHVIRCPPGFSKWSTQFIQVPKIPILNSHEIFTLSFSDLNLDYSLAVLMTILTPVHKRDLFLKPPTIAALDRSNRSEIRNQWVIVDSDGEDEPEDVSFFKESDLVALLNQVPFESIFRRILLICQINEEEAYEPNFSSDSSMLKLLSFANQFIDILRNGFITYYTDRYRQLIKLVGRLILHTVQYITDHVENFLSTAFNSCGPENLLRISVEYDAFLLRAITILISGKNIGTLQFLAATPFHLISSQNLWVAYTHLTKWQITDVHGSICEDISIEFLNDLISMNESDAFYLLTVMANLAIARDSRDESFVRIVTFHLFEIGFLNPMTRDSCSKNARDLLSNMTKKYQNLISVLIHIIKMKIDVLKNMSLYLLKDLTFEYWKPNDNDLTLLSNWLLNFQPYAIENQIARFIIQSTNWDFNDSGQLYLPYELHCKIALIIAEGYFKWDRSPNLFSESVKQVTRTTDNNFSSWCWETLQRLHLHGYDRSNDLDCLRITKILRSLPSFETHSDLDKLKKAVDQKNPLACYLALLMTPLGHSLPILCSSSFNLFDVIIQNYKLEAVIKLLFFIVPLFSSAREGLLKSEKFKFIVTTILAADKTYMQMAKSLISSEFPGYFTKLFGEMIQAQLNQYMRFGTKEKKLVRLWTEIIVQLENWNKDNNMIFILEILARHSFAKPECHSYFKEFFTNIYKELPVTNQSGIVSFLFNWSTATASLFQNSSYPQMPFLMHYIYSIELELEDKSGFWKALTNNLYNQKLTLEAAIKKACNSTKYSTSLNYLSIYRWGQQALDMNLDHPLILIFWQKFFLRFLHRAASNENQQSGVGERFFEGMINSSFHKKLKKRIHELLDFLKDKLSKLENSDRSKFDNSADNPQFTMDFLRNNIKLVNAFTLWVEESQLHNNTLYLPSLPPQYLPNKLLNLIDGELDDWTECIDYEEISTIEKKLARNFIYFAKRSCWIEPFKITRNLSWQNTVSSRTEEILKRLKTYDKPLDPPPIHQFNQILPVATQLMFVDLHSMAFGLKPHLIQLTEFAQNFSLQISQHTGLDCSYTEYLPELYKNVESEAVVNVRCSGTKNWQGCTGSAHVLFRFTEARLNERIGHLIQQNRIEYQTLLNTKATKPPPSSICIAAVFLEDYITNLILINRNQTTTADEQRKSNIVGIELFYTIVGLLNEDTNFYPPTRQLFYSFVEVLGQEFILADPYQNKRLVQTAIKNPNLVQALAPNMNLANSDPTTLLAIYESIINIPKKERDLAFVILTKLDLGFWLRKFRPKLHERSQLITLIWNAITSYGLVPDKEALLVHDTYRNHLKTALLYDFPQHYGEILNHLLEGSEKQLVSLDVWYDFFNSLSVKHDIKFFREMDPFVRKRDLKRFATEVDLLHHQILVETALLLFNHFTKERLSYGMYGLYPKYRSYIEPISTFIQLITYAVITSSLKQSHGQLSNQILETVWPIVRDIYSPWILPYNNKMIQQSCAKWIQELNFEASGILQPWISSDSELAMIFVNDFTDSILFLSETLPGSPYLFSYLWNFYMDNYAQMSVKEHVLNILHNCFISIPWSIFWPTLSDISSMNKVVEKYLPHSHSFLAVVFAQINWIDWTKQFINSNTFNYSTSVKVHSCLLNLSIRLAHDVVARESPTWINVMEKIEFLNWSFVKSSSLEPILNWFVMSICPKIVIFSETTHHMDRASLRLLKIASGILIQPENPSITYDKQDLNRKRYLFIRCYVKLIVNVATKYKNLLGSHPKNFESSIQDMLEDVLQVFNGEKLTKDEFMPLIKDLINLMANHFLGILARNAFISFIVERREEIPICLLHSIIQLSFSTKVAAYVTIPLIENCIRFSLSNKETTWESLSEVSIVTNNHPNSDLSHFFEISSKDGHFLVLYCLLFKRFKHLSQGGLSTVSFLTDLIKNIKPKEQNEAVLPLIYGIILKLCVQLLKEAEKIPGDNIEKGVKKLLNYFVQHLTLVGEDKQSWGLLGAFGIGKASQLSIGGRLFSRCLSVFLAAQLPNNVPIRLDIENHFTNINSKESSGVKVHPELNGILEALENLKLNRGYSDYFECIENALNLIKNPNESFSTCDKFIENISIYLFTESFLFQNKHLNISS